mgnify:CR=1 FL=1
METKEDPYKYVVIAGGGRIGSNVADQIEKNHNVKIIEENHDKAKYLSEKLEYSTV